MRVAFITSRDLIDLSEDDRLALPPLADLGIEVVPVEWGSEAKSLTSFDLVVIRSPWDWYTRGIEFTSWLRSVADSDVRLANRACVHFLDKSYLRALDANSGASKNGVFTAKPGTLTNDFFVSLLDMSTKWQKAATEGLYEGVDRTSGKAKWTATPVDLVFGSHSELRAIAEVYAAEDGKQKLAQDFVKAWGKVMMLDRFDVSTQ